MRRFPGYEVSNLGRVRRGGRILKTDLAGGRYPRIRSSRGSKQRRRWVRFLVHVEVARAFLGRRTRHEVDHLDGDTKNPAVRNLEWVTHSENVRRLYERKARAASGAALPPARRGAL